MPSTTKPSKESLCEYLARRALGDEPPPTPEEIRRQLGWDLIPANRRPDQASDD